MGYFHSSSHLFLQPLRRNRVYIAGENVEAGSGNFDSQLFVRSLRSMERPDERYPLDRFLDADLPQSRLTAPQLERLNRKLASHPVLRTCDAIIDVAKTFTDSAVDMLTCPRPSSAPYSLRRQRVVRGVERMRLQGLWENRCPALLDFAKNKQGDKFLSDLAGNAFTLHVVGAAFMAQSAHSAIRPPPCTPPRRALSMRSALVLQAIVEGVKTVENRHCSLEPGWYMLHLSKAATNSYAAPSSSAVQKMTLWPASRVRELRGKIVGCCMLGPGRAHETQEAAERVFGEWANVKAGRFQHEILGSSMLCEHHPAAGRLGPWTVPITLLDTVWWGDAFVSLRAEMCTRPQTSTTARIPEELPLVPEGTMDPLAGTATGCDLAPCGRAKAGFVGRAGCLDPTCLQCWPCALSDEDCPSAPAALAKKQHFETHRQRQKVHRMAKAAAKARDRPPKVSPLAYGSGTGI